MRQSKWKRLRGWWRQFWHNIPPEGLDLRRNTYECRLRSGETIIVTTEGEFFAPRPYWSTTAHDAIQNQLRGRGFLYDNRGNAWHRADQVVSYKLTESVPCLKGGLDDE